MKNCQKIRFLAVVFALSLPACATPARYSAEPIEAWVVDAETKQPLENVVVVANWELETTSWIIPHQTNSAGPLMLMEAVTDKNGRFFMPAWGPKWHAGSGRLTDRDPELIFFKSGYQYRRVSNSQYLRPSKYSDVGKPAGTESKPSGSKRISFWSGERIELRKFNGKPEQYADHLDSLMISLRFIEEDCNWQKVPNMVVELDKQSQLLKRSGIVRGIYSPTYLPTNEVKCGSPKKFFENYGK